MPHADLTFDRFHGDVINFTNGTSAERLCERRPAGYVVNTAASANTGQSIYNSQCASCHTVNGGGFPDPDLTCKGARVYKELVAIDSGMAGVSLTDLEVAHVRKYLDSLSCGAPLASP